MLIIHVWIKNEIKQTDMISIFKNCVLNVLRNVLIHFIRTWKLTVVYSIGYSLHVNRHCLVSVTWWRYGVGQSARSLPWAAVRWLRAISECSTLYGDGQC